MRMRWVLMSLALVGSIPAWGQQAPTAALNQITSVQVSDGTVEIDCAQKPNFSTFSLYAPSRLVIDFPDTVLVEKAHEQAVHQGGLVAVRTENFRSDTSTVARVILTLEPDVSSDVQAEGGNVLKVHIAPFSAHSAVAHNLAQEKEDKDKKEKARLDAEAKAKAASDAKARADAEAKAAEIEAHAKQVAEADAKARADAEAKAKAEEKARLDAEAKAKAAEERLAQLEAEHQADAKARADAEAKAADAAKAKAEAEAQAERERQAAEKAKAAEAQKTAEAEAALKKQQQAEASAREAVQEARAAEEAKRKQQAEAQEQARLAEEARQKQVAAERAREQAEAAEHDRVVQEQTQAKAKAAEKEAHAREQAETEKRAREQAEAEARAEAKRLADQREAERLARVSKARNEEASASSASTSSTPSEVRSDTKVASAAAIPNSAAAERVTPHGMPTEVTLVGYKQNAMGGRVFVRSNNDSAHFSVSESGPRTVVLEMENARIGQRNSARPLDTSFFPGAVSLISPTEDKRAHAVRVEIKLKDHVSYETRLEGNEVVIDFQAPDGTDATDGVNN
jgi:hypothetical protein